MKRVLFLCTGNYYRSRFAEEWFNHRARQQPALDWIADSRGLALERGTCNVGPISQHTRHALQQRGITLDDHPRGPEPLQLADLEKSDRIIAVKEAEHRPLIDKHFTNWSARIEYWHVHDLDAATPEQAIAQLQQHVEDLLAELRSDPPA